MFTNMINISKLNFLFFYNYLYSSNFLCVVFPLSEGKLGKHASHSSSYLYVYYYKSFLLT